MMAMTCVVPRLGRVKVVESKLQSRVASRVW
jgi:hypothetical protein